MATDTPEPQSAPEPGPDQVPGTDRIEIDPDLENDLVPVHERTDPVLDGVDFAVRAEIYEYLRYLERVYRTASHHPGYSSAQREGARIGARALTNARRGLIGNGRPKMEMD